jgi:hypothetical protein
MRLPLSVRWVAGIAVTAAVAGAITAVTVANGTSSTIQNGGGTSPSAATGTTVQAKLLAAFSAASGDIGYTRTTATNTSPGADNATGESWVYPWQPSTGQRVYDRQILVGSDGAPLFDTESIYDSPAPLTEASPNRALGAKGSQITVNYYAKTWSEEDVGVCIVCQLTSTYPANLTELIKASDFKEVGPATVDGHRAIEFRSTGVGSNSTAWLGYRSTLWVDAATYLPLRLTGSESLRHGYTDTVTTDYQILPATPANLAKLTPPIPAGFRKVANAQ